MRLTLLLLLLLSWGSAQGKIVAYHELPEGGVIVLVLGDDAAPFCKSRRAAVQYEGERATRVGCLAMEDDTKLLVILWNDGEMVEYEPSLFKVTP